MLPNFLIIGAMKAGTTSLYSYLKEHPDVFMPVNKEPNFFSINSVWAKGIKYYESLFAGSNKKKAIGEASVSYTKHPYYKNVPERIYSIIPHVKLIYILRSPIERIYSHYLHNVYATIETDPVEKAIFDKPLYIQASLYYMQIEQYLKYFPRENLMIILLDDMKKDPVGIVKKAFEFLEVDSSFVPPNIHEMKHQSKLKKGKDNMLMKLFRKMPFFYHYLSDKLPDNIKSLSSNILKQKMENIEPVSDDLYNKLVDEVIDDVKKLSMFLNRDLTFWDLKKKGE